MSPRPALDAATPRRILLPLLLPLLLTLATLVRFYSLPDRGIFDSDQGHTFLVLRAWLVDGIVPLLGTPASVGVIHHGAAYYFLLAPVAWVSGLDPTVVAMLFAAAGVGATAMVWWLARSIAGPLAGLTAGLIFALSPTAIAASITIWNPNLIGLIAPLTLATAWHAWSTGRPRWWVAALAAATLTIQLHIMSVLCAVPVAGLLVADIRRSAPGPARRAVLRAALLGLVVAGVMFLPLVIHELSSGFSEVRGALAYLASNREPGAFDPLSRLLIVTMRMASWPVVGLIIDAPIASSVLTGLVIATCLWRWRAATGSERTATRWLVIILAIGAVGLTLLAPDLAKVIRGLPNDQYHAFTDPIVALILGLGLAGIVGMRRARGPRGARLFQVQRAMAMIGLAVILSLELVHLPPRADPDGGWPAALAGAQRVARDTPARTILVLGLPDFKPTAGFIFPLLQEGRQVIDGQREAQGTQAAETGKGSAGQPGALVVVCDRLFEPVIKLACGGPAEMRLEHPDFPRLIDRFDLSPRTSISVYLPPASGG